MGAHQTYPSGRADADAADAAAGPDRQGPAVSGQEAEQVLRAIVDITNNYVEVHAGLARPVDSPAAHADVPARWQPLLREWWMITNGTVTLQDGVRVSLRGDCLQTHIELALARTQPLQAVLLAEAGEPAREFLDQEFTPRVEEFRKRAVQESVSQHVDEAAGGLAGSDLDFEGAVELQAVRSGCAEALKVLGAIMTVSTRTAGVVSGQAQQAEALFRQALQAQELPPSIDVRNLQTLQTSLNYLQGGLNLVRAIVDVSDPAQRLSIYQQHQEKFGPVAGYTQMLKNLGQFVSGTAAVAGAGTYALASAFGRAELAARALTVGNSALGQINAALNVFGTIHGVVILFDSAATDAQRVEAGVEAASGGLGLIGKFAPAVVQKFAPELAPAVAPTAAALSGSLLVNFYAFKSVLEAGTDSYAGLIATGLNTCYQHMLEEAREISTTAMQYAAAQDLCRAESDPVRATELSRHAEALGWNLAESVKSFLRSATEVRGAGNQDPGGYAALRARFLPLQAIDRSTPELLLSFCVRLFDTVLSCVTDAEAIYREQLGDSLQGG